MKTKYSFSYVWLVVLIVAAGMALYLDRWIEAIVIATLLRSEWTAINLGDLTKKTANTFTKLDKNVKRAFDGVAIDLEDTNRVIRSVKDDMVKLHKERSE